MNSDEIKKRIKQRINNSSNNKKYISNLFTRTLIAVIIVLISAIYINFDKKNLNLYKEKLFETSLPFNKITKYYNKFFGKVIPIDIDKGTTKTVFNEGINYNKIDKYENGYKLELSNNIINSLHDGIVVFIGEKESYGNTIIVQGSDGTDIWYSNIDNIGVNLYDYISKDIVLGEAKDNILYLVFNKEDKYIGYEEYLK